MAVVRAAAVGEVDGDVEERGVVEALAEVVFADFAGSREGGFGDLVGPVSAFAAVAGLLDAGVDGEGRATGDAGNAEEFPAAGDFDGDGVEEGSFFAVKVLGDGYGEAVGHVKVGWAFFGVGVVGVLRERDGYGPCGSRAADDLAGVVDGFRPGCSSPGCRVPLWARVPESEAWRA